MWSAVISAVGLSVIGLALTTRTHQSITHATLQSQAVAVNFLTYDKAAAAYAQANPSFEGVITPDLLLLPSAYQNLGGWRSATRSGHMISYPTGAFKFAPDIADAMVRKAEGQVLVGRISPVAGAPNPLNCWAFVSPTDSCVLGVTFPTLISDYSTPGAPVVLRKIRS
jgi:PilM